MKFLVDVNLPKYFAFFNSPDFVHLMDINPQMSDTNVWNYAKKNSLIILTKDSDFYYKSISEEKSVKVIYFRLGNQKLSELHSYFTKNWDLIKNQIEHNWLILASNDEIEIIL
ncbi:MAG: DUF5615 family PIN-like protein [Bacteroidetes bacterium]|nr:DUF5615 family PIN-like protein [Bacteroidota bacterium]